MLFSGFLKLRFWAVVSVWERPERLIEEFAADGWEEVGTHCCWSAGIVVVYFYVAFWGKGLNSRTSENEAV